MTPRNVRRIVKASEARRAKIATSGTETSLGATWTGYPHPARGGDIPGAQTGDFDCCVRDVDRETAQAVAMEREAIAAWLDRQADDEEAIAMRPDRDWLTSASLFMSGALSSSASSIRSGAHNEGAR